MIVVTGTKRSGTSMWMQILKAAGYPLLGEAFPQDWGETIRDANPEGFFESPLRYGIYYATNPHPRTGAFLPPGPTTRRVAVKIFATGMVRTDLAYVDKVVATMRHFREYSPSLARLRTIERENRRARAVREGRGLRDDAERPQLSPVLEWWRDNYGLIRDALVRRYPLHMVSYDAVLREPELIIPEALRWLGGGDADAAVQAIDPELRTGRVAELQPDDCDLTPDQAALFDELYMRIDRRKPLDAGFIDRLNSAQDALEERIADEEAAIRRARVRHTQAPS